MQDMEEDIYQIETKSPGPVGSLPLTEEMLLTRPSGDIFGLTQNAGMANGSGAHGGVSTRTQGKAAERQGLAISSDRLPHQTVSDLPMEP